MTEEQNETGVDPGDESAKAQPMSAVASAYRAGLFAYRAGVRLSENPYPESDKVAREAWADAWMIGCEQAKHD